MWCVNGTVSAEPSGRVKIGVKGMVRTGVVVIKQQHIAHYLGENFDRKEWWAVRQSVVSRDDDDLPCLCMVAWKGSNNMMDNVMGVVLTQVQLNKMGWAEAGMANHFEE
jgi:hypothetical protein